MVDHDADHDFMTTYKFNLPRDAATAIFVVCLLLALMLHAVPALLAGLLAFVLTRGLLSILRTRDLYKKLRSHEFIASFVVGLGSIAVLAIISVLVVRLLEGESLRAFSLKVAETITQIKQFLPPALAEYVPQSLFEMRELASDTLKEHVNAVAGIGSGILRSLLLTVIGWITGVLAAVSITVTPTDETRHSVFYRTWHRHWSMLATAFKNVAWAQTKIAAINATLTGVYLLAVMPALGWNLPYVKTLILATFLFGLLPVVGNIVSNTLICTIALSVAFPAAVISAVFLLVIHKLEYFLSARIQGHRIGAKVWELLIVLFAFEIMFGPAGMVAAPVIYAFVKAELKRIRWLN